MADLANFGNADRDLHQALIALKKGTQLLKYGRKGKPKFYPFRLSNDESSLIWISSNGERSLNLASVSKIIPGQRTAVFQRFLCPEKDYLSFSLIYNNDKRSLDLICKDKVEAEVWFAGLRALISSGQGGRSKIDGWSDGGFLIDDGRDLTSNSPSNSSVSAAPDISSPETHITKNPKTSVNNFPRQIPQNLQRSDVALDLPSMQVKGLNSDVFRVSVSSAPSTSSHGSAQDDCDALGDVYVWGEIICESPAKVGGAYSELSTTSIRSDVLLPKPLESNVVLDVHHVACGVRHAALVTRQGEVFTWGEECGGRLGHGVGKDVIQPRLVESLGTCNTDFVACGEFHTCAVTVAGELYTWGDGRYNAGLLGHGSDISHWMPKRVSGPLDGLQVAQLTCGPWHTALITSFGQLFTFGDGTFGALGHGNRESVSYPREVDSLMGLKTVSVACGVWHTAAAVEVIVTQSSASVSSGKLFTWGDGDKNRLGHGDREPRLKPTCVPSLIDYNFHKLACGHSLTVGLTTSGRIFTMGSTVYGQLGNPLSDGKVPCLVEDKLASESVEHVACGSYHVAVLTSRNEVYTWGKGANGRLGHGDIEDRKTPTLVEALKDRHVKHVSCGSDFTAAICLHKWVSGAEQSQCSSCRQAFGFTRKRHNCYNCGLVHCHSCSSRKALRAAMAPNPGKAYRVCDSCYVKLIKLSEHGSGHNKKNAPPRLSGENKDRLDKAEIRSSKAALSANSEITKHLDNKATKHGKKIDSMSLVQASQIPFLLQVKDVTFAGGFDTRRMTPKPASVSGGSSVINSRAVSPFSRRSSPPRSATPIPTTSGLSFSKSIAESLKKTNELLNQEAQKLRAQVDSLKQKCEFQEFELQRAAKKTQEAVALAAEESAKAKAAKEVIKSLTAQLKDMAERLPPGVYDNSNIRSMNLPNGFEYAHADYHAGAIGEHVSRMDMPGGEPDLHSSVPTNSAIDEFSSQERDAVGAAEINPQFHNQRFQNSNGREDHVHMGQPNGIGLSGSPNKPASLFGTENGFKSRSPGSTSSNQVEAEWIEQYEPGVYITLVALRDGTRDLKRVRFSRRRFGEHQAETWWSENREKVYQRFNIRGSDRVSSVASVQSSRRSDEASAVSQNTAISDEASAVSQNTAI